MKRDCTILSLLLLLAAAAFGQMLTSSSASTGPNGTSHGSATFQAPPFAPRPVVGAPYYGEEVSERVQTLANGAHITQTNTRQKTWRDSQGRTRTERPMAMGNPSMPNAPTIIQIIDPVAGYICTLDTEKKVAHRVALVPPPGGPQSANAPQMANRSAVLTGTVGAGSGGRVVTGAVPVVVSAYAASRPEVTQKSDAQRPQVTTEVLGTKTIDGVVVEGTRQTMVYPTGFQGNDAPFSVISETWRSPDLKLLLLSTSDDPRSGVNTQKIANLSTQEPDPTLFMLPTGYTIVDETSSFTITWGAQ